MSELRSQAPAMVVVNLTLSSSKPNAGTPISSIPTSHVRGDGRTGAIRAPARSAVYNAGYHVRYVVGCHFGRSYPINSRGTRPNIAPQSELFDDAEQRQREAEAEKKKAAEAAL